MIPATALPELQFQDVNFNDFDFKNSGFNVFNESTLSGLPERDVEGGGIAQHVQMRTLP
jgi:hypothetical protein